MTTRVYYRTISNPKEVELPFVRWTSRSLVVVQPEGWHSPGQEMTVSRRKLHRWLRVGKIRIEGYRPEWAEEQSR
jgi:hypothetical protein